MHSINELLDVIGGQAQGDIDNHIGFSGAASLSSATENDLIWVKPGRADMEQIFAVTLARTVIVPTEKPFVPSEGQVLVAVENPRLAFIKALQHFFVDKNSAGIHETAFIHPEAELHPSVSVGPFAYVGRAKLGKGCVVHSHVSVHHGVTIGKQVIIHSGTVIGADGFGFEREASGKALKFPHIGGVIIEDDVEIGANTCIDRGVLDDTILRRGVKVDNLVHIAHNVDIGEDSFVIANAMVAGSVKIGARTWVAPSASIINGINIGSDALIGMSALVTRSVPDGETWAGIPARPLAQYKARERLLSKLVAER